jgi:poly-gamma-glutamate synthesis protein (capsule biosynthesis protein)
MTETARVWPWSLEPGPADASLLLVGETNVQGRTDPAGAFAYVRETLHAADIVFGQLEGPLSPPSPDPEGAPDIPHKQAWRHSDPSMVDGLKAAGFTAVSCASNVCYPPRAALDSIRTLDAAGIGHCGAGENLPEARTPFVAAVKGIRFGFLSYTSVFWPVGHAATADKPGCATIKIHTGYQPGRRALEMPGADPVIMTVPDGNELAAVKADVETLRRRVDVVIVSCHWGVSSKAEIVDYQQAVGRAAIESGADIVFGHHPHVIQGIERYRGKTIFYSLGNFAFDWAKMRGRNLDGLLVRALAGSNGIRDLAIVPVRRNPDNLVEILDPAGAEGERIVRQLEERSAPFGTRTMRRGSDVTVAGVGE